jgi:hypothetical protein
MEIYVIYLLFKYVVARIPEFRFTGGEEVYLWCGVGPQPGPRGTQLPDEDG